MTPIQNDYTLIIGAGALGAMYAQQIQHAGRSVAFFAEGERAERLTSQGIDVNGTPLAVQVYGRREIATSVGTPARIIVALKDQHMATGLAPLREICGTDTTVLSVMNGIDSEEQIATALGESLESGRVLYCMVAGMDAVRDGVTVRYTRLGTVFFGRRKNSPTTEDPRVAAMKRFFEGVGIDCVVPEDMERAIWNKFMLNIGINQWSAVLGATYSAFHRFAPAQNLMRRAMAEVLAVAQARGIALTNDDLEHWYEVINTLSPDGKTSMVQDVEAGRKTEVEMFAGRVIQLGQEAGVPTPVNEVLLETIQTIELMRGAV